MTTIIPRDDHAGELVAPEQPTLEEMRSNLLLGIRTALRQASGIKDPKEFELVYGTMQRQLSLVLDHVILLAAQRTEMEDIKR